jgi:hypothetical protein
MRVNPVVRAVLVDHLPESAENLIARIADLGDDLVHAEGVSLVGMR